MRSLLPLLPKPSRYIGIEEGTVHKDISTVSLHIALAFPDMYEVGMSYLGHKILADIVNAHQGWWAERVFAPCEEAGSLLQRHGVPLCTLESGTSVGALDAVGFSITHELCYTNVLYMLDLAGIPLWSKERLQPQPTGRTWPLIIAGGGCTLAAEPLAPFIDIMLLGEGEELIIELLAVLDEAKKNNLPKKELLLEASRIPGTYIPSFFDSAANDETDTPTPWVTPLFPHHTSATRRIAPNMDAAPYPAKQVIPFGAVHNRLALEIARGCTRGCRFCQAGSIYRPVRERSVNTVSELLETCLTATGFDDVSFLSLSTGDFSALKHLFMSTVDRCAKEQISVSLPSLRVGSIDDSIMERMAGIRRTGATLAPEAGSQRLRDVINKGISEQDLLLHVQKLFEHGWEQVKLYFMIGLPTETDEDLLAIVDLCKKARDSIGPGIKRMQITAAISPFVPKPHTPFQWERQASLQEIRRRVGVLLQTVKGEKRIKLRWHEPEMSYLEGIFSRGDRRLAPVLETAYRKGAIFTSWIDKFTLEPWLEALKAHGLDPDSFLRERTEHETLPWDHLQSGLSNEFFSRERRKSRLEKVTPDCRYAACQMCGACDKQGSPSLLQHPSGESVHVILNRPQRDQDAHTVSLDQYGRVVSRHWQKDKETGIKKGKNLPPALAPHLTQKTAQLRFWYSKTKAAVFISQLELQNIFDRALRRAQLPLTFSQGFHPLPLLSFGRALPVGVASLCEWFSVFISENRSLPEVMQEMNAGLPAGLRIDRIETCPLKSRCTNLDCEEYTLRLLRPDVSHEVFATAWNRIISAADIPWERATKKHVRQLDARQYFTAITVQDASTVHLQCDWADQGYVSPLSLCLHAMAHAGLLLEQHHVLLTKTGQFESC